MTRAREEWEKRFPKAAALDRLIKQGKPYLKIMYMRDGAAWSEWVPTEEANSKTLEKMYEETKVEHGRRVTWHLAVWYLEDGWWTFERFGQDLQESMEFLRGKEQGDE